MELNLNKTLIVFDIETTGTNLVKDRIVEYCFYKIKTNGEKEIRTQLINPCMPIPPEVTAIHGIKDSDVADKPTFKDVAAELHAFIGNADFAGFNSNKFDVPFLIEEFLKAGIDFQLKGRRLIDVQNIFHKMEPRNLKAAYKFYCGQDLENAHTAEADTVATYEVLAAQIQRYTGVTYKDNDGNESSPLKNDMQALHEFSYNSKNADLVGHIVYDKNNVEVFNFGKHKGRSVEEVFKTEPSYYDWMQKSDFPMLTKKLIQLIKLKSASSGKINSNLFD
ncbi:MAG: 3'-5' exonuclease [Bacteroidales bacterium]|nr:3'-5' exonuclease [Bacteroidales bacterium]